MSFLDEASALARQDIAEYSKEPTPVATPAPIAEPEAPPSTPVAEPVAVTPEPAPEPTPAPLTEAIKREFKLKYKGQDLTLPEDEVITFAQKGYDYTQKSQLLAQQQAEAQTAHQQAIALQTQVAQERADLQAVLSDKGKLKQLLEWTTANTETLGLDPETPLTPHQAEQMISSLLENKLAEFEEKQKKELTRSQFKLETNRLESEYKAAYNTHVGRVLEQHPILKEVQGIEGQLQEYGKAYFSARLGAEGPLAKIDPVEVFTAVAKEAERRANAENARIENHLKMRAAKHQQVVAKGIEPAGGTPPVPVPSKPLKLGSKELTAQAVAELQKAWRDT